LTENIKIFNEPNNQTEKVIPFDGLVSLPPKFTHLDLFSGIGGFALAAKSTWKERYENVGFCEIDKFCQKVLRKNFGNDIKIFDDIKELKGEQFGTVDLITGGFPCQPFSAVGKRAGKNDDRYLWPEMFRVIRESKARWVVGENVADIKDMALDAVLTELANNGYTGESFIIPACAIDAPHRRDRMWIVAHSTGIPIDNNFVWKGNELFNSKEILWPEPNSIVPRMVDGVSNGLDRHRLRALGNAIVPQVAEVLLAAVKTIDDNLSNERRSN